MPKAAKLLIAFVLACGIAAGVGFLAFAHAVKQTALADPPTADAIVVLTGGEDRIEAGIKLLAKRKGKRLLISGVNPSTRVAEIERLTGYDRRLFDCCIDFGYRAVDTITNAEETRAWAANWRFSRLILVTSSYHMPRSLLEFARVLPDVELLPYPVVTRSLQLDAWWQHRHTARVMGVEYVKFLASAVRLAAARVLGIGQRQAAGGVEGPRPARG
ncbi:MAG: YdcF family protein [Hyphomicrobiaceae bacterium]